MATEAPPAAAAADADMAVEYAPPDAGRTVWTQATYPVGCDVLAKDPSQIAGFYAGKVIEVPEGETAPPGTARGRAAFKV